MAYIQRMSFETCNIPINDKDIDIKKTLQEIEQMKPSVCLFWNESDIDLISDIYSELVEAKCLLLQNFFGKGYERAGRTFAKKEKKQNLLLPEKTI